MHLKFSKNTHKEADSMAWKRGRGNPFHLFFEQPSADFKVLEGNLTNL